jgi:hypothetical protein
VAAAGEAVSMPRQIGALVAGWIVPGAGHAVLGRYRRAVLFAVIVLGSFGLGLAHDGRLALRLPEDRFLTTLQVVANVGVGPLDAVARRSVYGEVVYAIGEVATSEREDLRRLLRDRLRSPLSAYGTAYLWTAGLMNLLLLLDVWDIGRGRKP